MNEEEYKKYVNDMCINIKDKLDEESDEFDFFLVLVNTFNKVCNEKRKLENALDEIEKWLKTKADRNNLNDLLQIIKKAKEK